MGAFGRKRVLDELRTGTPIPGDQPYFRQSAGQIGVTETNDFVFGTMHEALRRQIFDGVSSAHSPSAPR